MRVDWFVLGIAVGTLGHPVGQTIDGNEHRRAGLEVLLESWSRGGGSELGPKSLEHCPGDSRVAEPKLGEIRKGRVGLQHCQRRMLLGDLEFFEELLVSIDSAVQQGRSCVWLDVLHGVAAFNGGIGGVTGHKVASCMMNGSAAIQ